MGAIVFWTLVRIVILIPSLWLLFDWMEYKYWWMIGIMSIYGIVLHPAYIQYRLFLEENKEILNNTLCATCAHFDETAVICLKYDKHPTVKFLPCEGFEWEPKNNSNNSRNNEEY
ncbi:MAG: hypothetical protein F9K45_04180 [Melioribacteraceae bacterium]|nr:MAG: hypothetical protein F9K45_04180 [Melioribacteraceae bacterium]